jgi:hypothetical protein
VVTEAQLQFHGCTFGGERCNFVSSAYHGKAVQILTHSDAANYYTGLPHKHLHAGLSNMHAHRRVDEMSPHSWMMK